MNKAQVEQQLIAENQALQRRIADLESWIDQCQRSGAVQDPHLLSQLDDIGLGRSHFHHVPAKQPANQPADQPTHQHCCSHSSMPQQIALLQADLAQQESERQQLDRKLQQAIHAQETVSAIFNALLASAPVGIAFLDQDLRYVHINQVLAATNGLPCEAHLGHTIREVLPQWADYLEPILHQVLTTRQPLLNQELSGETNPSGVCRYGLVNYYPVCLPNGEILGVGVTLTDITHLKVTAQALRLSEERYRLLVESLPQYVYMTASDGSVQYCNHSWTEYTGLALEQTQALGWQQAVHPDDLSLAIAQWSCALKSGNAFSCEFRLRRADGSYHWHLSRGVPLNSENGQVINWLTVFTEIDDQKRTEQIQRFLAEASQAFAAASLDLQTVLDTVTRLVSETTGDLCVLTLLSEDQTWLKPVSFYHTNPEAQIFIDELLLKNPRFSRGGLSAKVLETKRPLLIPVLPQAQIREAIAPEYRPYLDRFSMHSLLIVPLQVQGRLIGTVGISRERPGEPYDEDDQIFLQDLADRAALAIENARLYQTAQQAQQHAEAAAARTAQLQQVTAALSTAVTPEDVGTVILNQGCAALGASAAIMALVVSQGTELELIQTVNYPDHLVTAWKRFSIQIATPLTDAARQKNALFFCSPTELATHYPHLQPAFSNAGIQAIAAIPLLIEEDLVGLVGWSFRTPQDFEAEDRIFMLALAQQAAQTIVRARLYEAEQRSRAASEEALQVAEAANRVKDEFLAILSHELRTPLNPILGWTKLLRTRKFDPEKTELALETIERNSKLQAQLVEDLLDVSRILRGKLKLNAYPIDFTATVRAAIESVQVAAEAKSIQIHTDIPGQVKKVLGDPNRLQQIVWNLLSNAVKFTPSGGHVTIQIENGNDEVKLQVKETGQGMQPDFLPYAFDYFRQADSRTTRFFGGLGLGLAIVRYLVELHGGSVQAQSAGEGLGSTFIVRLPQIQD